MLRGGRSDYERQLEHFLTVAPEFLREFDAWLQGRGASATSRMSRLKVLLRMNRLCLEVLGFSLDDLRSEGDLERLLSSIRGVKPSSLRAYYEALRRFFEWRRREGLAGLLRVSSRDGRRVPKVLREEEVYRMVEAAPTLRDRLIILILWETGCRPGELLNLRIGDVQFDEYSAILYVRGKTGERRLRAFLCKPDLVRYLNDHPFRNDPDAYLFLSTGPWRRRERITLNGLYLLLRRLGRRALGRPVYPYLLRHSAFTRLSRYLTDRELMQLGGWTSPAMISVYSHLSGRDVDEKLLALHGITPEKKEVVPLLEVRKCPSCGAENAPVAVYCHECGKPLAKAKPTLEDLKRLLEDERIAKYFADLVLERLMADPRKRKVLQEF